MRIGILTFYRVANFGANLQGLSTYLYLKHQGYDVIFMNYVSKQTENQIQISSETNKQMRCHLNFVDEMIPQQTKFLYNSEDVVKAITDYHIDAVIIGSDAVVQHHPFLSRIHKGKRKPFYIAHPALERMFPNPFWGIGFSSIVPTAMMSVSSQNSSYKRFPSKLKKEMDTALSQMKYISVRDDWTQKMFHSIDENLDVQVTPDPVFAFNQNASQFIPTREDIITRFSLPKNYVLLSLHSQSLSEEVLVELKEIFLSMGKHCVAFPMPTGIMFKHPFDYQIQLPLSPIDWYAIIKNADAYIGSNMHPIIVSLHNAVPCFSIDHWGTKNFFNKTIHDGSSKVEHILGTFGLKNNIRYIDGEKCHVTAKEVIQAVLSFPQEKVNEISEKKYKHYNSMMTKLLQNINVK